MSEGKTRVLTKGQYRSWMSIKRCRDELSPKDATDRHSPTEGEKG